MKFPARSLRQLSRRVLSGEVVFFVGAGFSRDSEQNTAERLILRLLVRFEAMTRHLEDAAKVPTRARELRQGLRLTFELAADDTVPLATWENAKTLSRSYYTFNDWICSAFSALLEDCAAIRANERKKLFAGIRSGEEQLLGSVGEPPLTAADLGALDLKSLLQLRGNDRGKALFLETMGFADPQIMAGPPLGESFDMTTESWRGRVRQRHQVLARLAREGLCPTTLTTNYDLLLEWAFRLAGLQPSGVDDPRGLLPPTTFQSLVRIAEANDFFGRGGYRSALIAKIHGCSDVYRLRRKTPASWQSYLPAMVFTFREIQNWREDAWSRDFLSTLLRTRTLVFCGYSGMDSVIHDTFRTVYEEMARKRKATAAAPAPRRAGPPRGSRVRTGRAPAYFLGLEGRTEFHGMEILRAATQALGEASPDLTDHPNYLRFFKLDATSFPNMDELMSWLFHLVFRQCQLAALRSDLRRTATLLLRHPCAESEIKTVRRNFLRLFRGEIHAARQWDDRPTHRRELERITGWTDRFQVGLLRELALSEALLRNEGPGRDFELLRSCPWYFPALERPDWTAWAAVVEVAVRRMIAVWRGVPGEWRKDSEWVRPGGHEPHPAVLFSLGERRPTPSELSLRLGFRRIPAMARLQSVLRGHAVWELHPQSIPWATERGGHAPRSGTPAAADIWAWAVRDDLTPLDAEQWLGKNDEREQRSPAA